MYMEFINSLQKLLSLPLCFTGIETLKVSRFHDNLSMTSTFSLVSGFLW